MAEIRVVLDAKNRLGECPRWHAASGSLYWLDINAQMLHRYVPADGSHTETPLAERVSAFAFRRGGGFLFAAGHSILDANENGVRRGTLATAVMPVDARFNDGAADANGRFWTGALNTERRPDNHLYCFDGEALREMDSEIGASNGIAWSADGRTMYFADSPRKTVFAYDFDSATGSIGGKRVFAATPDEAGVPDGIAADADGGVWCAYWDGWRVVRYDAAGRETARIAVPTPRPTACAFGGAHLDTLYITSASHGIDVVDAEFAGALFAVETQTRGVPLNLSR